MIVTRTKGMSIFLRNLADRCLRLPELRNFLGTDFDTVEATFIERQILEKKKILQFIYAEYCRPFVRSAKRMSERAKMMEIGSGASPLKQRIPELFSTDVIFLPWLDLSCSAWELPFRNASLDRIFLMFVFHHLGKIEAFLNEARRCLRPGGEMVIIDPAITVFSKLYYKAHVDNMDYRTKSWGYQGAGRLTDSNIALAWIVFFRDRDRFREVYPEFVIEKVEYNTCMAFLLSGGFRIRQLLPTNILKMFFKMENWIIRNITQQIAVTMVLTIKRS
jgi:SAM-dependent methyltransferase